MVEGKIEDNHGIENLRGLLEKQSKFVENLNEVVSQISKNFSGDWKGMMMVKMCR
jgi:hypothetical protein